LRPGSEKLFVNSEKFILNYSKRCTDPVRIDKCIHGPGRVFIVDHIISAREAFNICESKLGRNPRGFLFWEWERGGIGILNNPILGLYHKGIYYYHTCE